MASGVLEHREFAFYASARFLSATALQMQTVAIGWLVYALTRDPLALGFVGFLAFLPALALVLITGHVADRFDRRRILQLCYVAVASTATALSALAFSGYTSTWPLYGMTLVLGVTRAFANPAGQALVPSLLPPAALSRGIAFNSSVWQLAIIVGPALGGVLLIAGAAAVFITSAGLFLAALLLLSRLSPRPPVNARREVSLRELSAGLRFVWRARVLLGATSLDLFAVLLGGATALLPIYAHEILEVGPWGLGLLRAMPAVGAAGMALALTRWPLRRRVGVRMLQGVALFGAATVGLGLSSTLVEALVALLVLGAADMISVVVRHSLVQLETPDEMRGRVAAINSVFIGASNELGELESGLLAAAIGVVPAVIAGGVGAMGVAAVWSVLFPELRRRDRLVSE